MKDVVITTIAQVLGTLLITLIGVLGAWLSSKLAKRADLKNIALATDALVGAAQLTVLELQQTTVDRLKADSADGKLTKEEIKGLGEMLIDKTKEKMTDSAKDLLTGAGIDIDAMITSAGEAFIKQMK